VLKIIVEENPTVKRVVFKGNKDVRDKELLPIFVEQLGYRKALKLLEKRSIKSNFRHCHWCLCPSG
jgi:outer membrane protein assembly factor BamA